MTENLVLVYSTNRQIEAEMLKQFLSSRDITAFLLNKIDSAYLIGDIEVYVSPEDVINAKRFIEEFLSNE